MSRLPKHGPHTECCYGSMKPRHLDLQMMKSRLAGDGYITLQRNSREKVENLLLLSKIKYQKYNFGIMLEMGIYWPSKKHVKTVSSRSQLMFVCMSFTSQPVSTIPTSLPVSLCSCITKTQYVSLTVRLNGDETPSSGGLRARSCMHIYQCVCVCCDIFFEFLVGAFFFFNLMS